MFEYEQVCSSCARERFLDLIHHAACETCGATTLVGITRAVAEKILIGPYD
jgi:rRNA maturation endonuclease Nob1